MAWRRSLIGAASFLVGFAVIVVAGQVIFPAMEGAAVTQPIGVYLVGIVTGLLSALLAIGLVLVYRTNRIINFAQGSLGGVAATLASELYVVFHWPYLAAVAIGLAAGVGASMLVEFGVIRRFKHAPRLILTVATIGVAQILGAFEIVAPYLINRGRDATEFRTRLESPLEFTFGLGGTAFQGDHFVVLVVAPVVLIGLFVFLRYTRYGVAARGVAENRDRARLLGVKVVRVSLLVWAIAGLLSALTAVLRAPILGFTLGAIGGVGLLYRALAAAVIGRMESIPVTVGAAILLELSEQAIFWYFGSGPANGFLFFVVVVALFVQRKHLGRVDPGSSSWQAVQEIRPVPAVLARLPEVRFGRWGLAVFGVLLLVLFPFTLSPSNTQLVSVIFIYGMVAISLVMLTGWSGNVSLGHWAIVGFGALVAGKLATQAVPADFFVAIGAGALAGTFVSVLVGIPALRIRGLFLGVTTLALAVASANWFFFWDVLTPEETIRRPVLFGVIDVSGQHAFYYVSLVGLALAAFIARNVRRSRLGRVQIAMRDNERYAQAFGVPPVRTKLVAFGLSGFVAALAGGLYAYNQQAVGAGRFPGEDSLLIFSMVVIGGMGSLTGAVLGAVYIRGTQYFLPAQFQLLASGAGMLFLLLVFPGGLGQLVFSWRDRFLRRVADRRGLIVPSLVADRRADTGLHGAAGRRADPDTELIGSGERP